MAWRMPAETAPHDATWMAFPVEGITLGSTDRGRSAGYAAWAEVANQIAQFEPVMMAVDPSEARRARSMLTNSIEILEAPLDEFWMRDIGPTFVLDDERRGVLGAVDWTFNGWGAPAWAQWQESAKVGAAVAAWAGAELVSSSLVNEGGGIQVDGEGTVLLTETVQLDPRRNPDATKKSVEAEMLRTLGARHAVWLPRGLTRDYDDFGTNGHVDIVAAIAAPGRMLLHSQTNPDHPDFAVCRDLRTHLETTTDHALTAWDIVDLPAPSTLQDEEGYVDYSYVNHLVVNHGVIACAFGEELADARARDILADFYPGRQVVSVDARELFARGGGIHCITQQQPSLVDPAGAAQNAETGA